MPVSITQIDLPPGQDPEAFATFMRDEFVPAIDHRLSRVGNAERVELVERATQEGHSRGFLWLVHFDGGVPGELGVRIDQEHLRRFHAFGAKVHHKVEWSPVGRWSLDDGHR